MGYEHIKYEVKDKIAYITLNRPSVLNSMDPQMKEELSQAIDEIDGDKNIWGVILTGEGRAFSTGTDISTFPTTVESARATADYAQKLFNRIEDLRQPVISAVNGFALGGGFELALASDIRVASEKAKFGFSEVKIGAIPCYGGSIRLMRVAGQAKAKELIFTGRMIDAQEALDLGLVTAVAAPEDLLAKAEELMHEILKNAPVAVSYAKRVLNKAYDLPLEGGLQMEQNMVGMLVDTHDLKEGSSAFLEKRKPVYQNC